MNKRHYNLGSSVFNRSPFYSDPRYWKNVLLDNRRSEVEANLYSCSCATEAIVELVLGVRSASTEVSVIKGQHTVSFYIKGCG